ncbi:MAG: hypothetical protein A2X12_08535 [Bacteroidetes bacterium GWE2_29_8]|nr:MAG: hypothetical protein A2X12_08535 [Bacteroidetes bacterium GWE2_29_8]
MDDYILVSDENNISIISLTQENIEENDDIPRKLERIYSKLPNESIILDLSLLSNEITDIDIFEEFIIQAQEDNISLSVVVNDFKLHEKLIAKFSDLVINTNVDEAKDYLIMDAIERDIHNLSNEDSEN